jgi:hypothetical protein
LGVFSAGIGGIFGLEMERGGFQRFAEIRRAFLRLIGASRLLPPVFLIFTTEGKRLRNTRVIMVGDNYQEKA